MTSKRGLLHRLSRAFLLQAGFISVAAIAGVYIAGLAIEEVLIKRALKEEAVYFWKLYDADDATPLPDTLNLTGYMFRPGSELPAMFAGLGPGFHSVPSDADFSVVYVSEQAGKRLYLTFDGERVSELALYFGLLPLTGALVVVYLATWISFRTTRRAISPIIALAREVHDYDPIAATGEVFEPRVALGKDDDEVQALADALRRLSVRIKEFVERERNFTRDASHELRSPLTVIRLAADMMLSEQALDEQTERSVQRIKRAATDMEELTQAFLLLARESDQLLETELVSINEVVHDELEYAESLISGKPVTVEHYMPLELRIKAPRRVLAVLIGNLLRNALSYTDAGTVEIRIEPKRLVIEDSGTGIEEADVENVFKPFFRGASRVRGGHGVGLTIVKRLSERFGWPVRIEPRPGRGTRVEVDFPQAESRPPAAS